MDLETFRRIYQSAIEMNSKDDEPSYKDIGKLGFNTAFEADEVRKI